MKIGQKITITLEKFRYLARYRGLVLIRETYASTFFLYYCPIQGEYVSSIKSLYYEGIPGTPMNASWLLMEYGKMFTVHKIDYPPTLKHLH